MRTGISITVTPQDRLLLEGIVRDRNSPQKHVFIAETNDDPKPFVWTAKPNAILAAVKRGREALESIH